MDVFTRLIPYVRPHFRKLLVSWLLACVIALIWGANFAAAWPLVKTLFEGKTLHDEVGLMMTAAEENIAAAESKVEELDARIAERQEQIGDDVADGKIMRLTADRRRANERVTAATTELTWLRWVDYRVMTWIPRDRFQTLVVILAVLCIATLVKCAALYVQEALVGDIVQHTLKGVREDCLRHAMELDYAKSSSFGAANLTSRFTFDSEKMAEGLTLLSGRVVREPLKALACIALALFVNWRLTLLSVVVVPALGYLLYRVGRSLKRASRRMMESMSKIYEQLEETLTGLKVVIAFGREDAHMKQFNDEYASYLKKSIKVVRYDALIRPITELLSTAVVMVVMLPCAYLVLSGNTEIWGVKLASGPVTMASVAMLYGALAGLLDPCTKLSRVYSKLKVCAAANDRIFAFLDEKPRVTKSAETRAVPPVSKSITFQDISFQYPQAAKADYGLNPLVLTDLHLTVKAGECVAIVGENGCGKSTLLSLLPRFHEPNAGEILIDEVPLSMLDASEFRRQTALVAQDTMLFSGTILQNIQYGRPDATEDEIRAAADRSSVTKFVMNLPNGLNTEVGQLGKSLSGGQRQRIALARAMIRDPKLLLLDEATSAIDAQSQQAIHEALETFVKGRTTLMVTHSITPAILRFVTRIVVINEGQVEADGSHEQLLAKSPTYQRLFGFQARAAAA